MINLAEIISKVENKPSTHLIYYFDNSREQVSELLSKSGISDNKLVLAHFLGQMSHESAGFKALVEFRSDKSSELKYGHKTRVGKILGNDRKGDGAKFKGRGIIQLTGRWNYTDMSKKLNIDLVNKPELASIPEIAFKIAIQYWVDKGLTALAAEDNVRVVTKKINGGFNGITDRIYRTNKYKLALKVGE